MDVDFLLAAVTGAFQEDQRISKVRRPSGRVKKLAIQLLKSYKDGGNDSWLKLFNEMLKSERGEDVIEAGKITSKKIASLQKTS